MVTSCIYKIVNLKNNRCYVGSAVDFRRRKSEHLSMLRASRHHSWKLQKDWNIYDESDFVFSVLEEVTDPSNLVTKEQLWIDSSFPYYNVNPQAQSSFGVKRSEETRKKISKAVSATMTPEHRQRLSVSAKNTMTPERLKMMSALGKEVMTEKVRNKIRASLKVSLSCPIVRQRMRDAGSKMMTYEVRNKISVANSGRVHSEETKKKISLARTGHTMSDSTKQKLRDINFGRKHTEATKLKLKGIKAATKPVVQLSLDGVFIQEFRSIKQALDSGFEGKGLINNCKGRSKSYRGFKFVYKCDYVS